jgi:3',5'-nucleoside bisphosphate phosphatase
MVEYRADLHIHTVISPCGDLEMSPTAIVEKAKSVGLSIIGITDHNCTKHAPLIRTLAQREGIFVLMGAEVTTREEVHCLTFFPDEDSLNQFQAYMEEHLPPIPLNTEVFGYQVVVNEQDDILEELPYLLISGLNASIEEVEGTVRRLNGLFIPAHINKNRYSVISQLGFIPFDLKYDALEIAKHTSMVEFVKAYPYLDGKTFIQSSDSHFIEEIGSVSSFFYLNELTFEEMRQAFHNKNGRFVRLK